MNKNRKFEFLEHTADVYVAAYGGTIREAFENAALALFEVMTDTTKVNLDFEYSLEVEAEDEYALLYTWLEALLVRFETTNTLFSKFEILSLKENCDGLKIQAKVWGEEFKAEKHMQKVAVKAVTYHRMEIIKEIDKVTLEFILDI